jgi:hypothetical protein
MTKVERIKILGTKYISYRAYEPSTLTGAHSTLTTINDEWYGEIASRRLPAELDTLPMYSSTRLQAVRSWQKEQYEEGYAAIYAAYPHLQGIPHHKDMGEISSLEYGE